MLKVCEKFVNVCYIYADCPAGLTIGDEFVFAEGWLQADRPEEDTAQISHSFNFRG
jgi:hypothetical protein